jgi:hypothetical protein
MYIVAAVALATTLVMPTFVENVDARSRYETPSQAPRPLQGPQQPESATYASASLFAESAFLRRSGTTAQRLAVVDAAKPSSTRPRARRLCGKLRIKAELARLVKAARVTTPQLNVGATLGNPYYLPREQAIETAECTTANVLAHELGHHITVLAALANGRSLEDEVAVFASIPTWIKQSADTLGYERSAHCAAHAFGARGSYTKCPHKAGRLAGRAVLQVARTWSLQTTAPQWPS